MRARAWAYATGLKSSNRPEAFCISVGNISWGGTGKTPLTGWLLDWARQRGLKAAVLTRGYGGKTDRRPLLVTPRTPPAESGDEPLMLCRAHPEAAILADPDRRRARAWAEENLRPDLYILDDGMQHLAIQRDLNLVTLNVRDFMRDWNRVIPAGTWREGSSALRRADAFMLRTHSDSESLEKNLLPELEKLRDYGVPLFTFNLKPDGLTPLRPFGQPGTGNAAASSDDRELQAAAEKILGGKTEYALLTAIASPQSVLSNAYLATGKYPYADYMFPDHHPYSTQDLVALREDLRNHPISGVELLPIVTTAKDAVKLEPHLADFPELRFFVLESRVEFTGALFTKLSFPDWLRQKKERTDVRS